MFSQHASVPSKMSIFDRANSPDIEEGQSIGLRTIGRVDNVVLAINVIRDEWDWTEPQGGVEYHQCLRGSLRYQFKLADQDFPPIDLRAGEILTIPDGFACCGSASDDAVVLVMERAKSWHEDS